MKINLTGTKKIKVLGLIVFGVLVLIITILSFGNNYFNSPSTGQIITSDAVKEVSPTTLTVEGITFSFSYPSTFQPSQTRPLTNGDVEKFTFVSPSLSPWNLSIQIRELAGGQISNDGSYNLRKTNPDTYTEEIVTLNSNKAYIMTSNTGGYNKVAFIVHDNIDANISLQSGSSADSEKMDAVLNQIISSWKWL